MEYFSPPILFEQKTGLRGLHTAWRMPDGLSYAEAEKRDDAIIERVMSEIGDMRVDKVALALSTTHRTERQAIIDSFDRLVSLNPTLQAIAFVRSDPIRTGQASIGVTSQFNVDDIKYFITTTKEQRNNNDELNNIRAEIGRRTDEGLQWQVSRPTLLLIQRQLDESLDGRNRHNVAWLHSNSRLPTTLTPS